jgi:hypothetical protein
MSSGFHSGPPLLSLYDTKGEPIMTLNSPTQFAKITYNGELLALLSYDGQLHMWEKNGLKLGYWDLNDLLTKNRGAYHFFSVDGSKLLILDVTKKQLHIYKISKN